MGFPGFSGFADFGEEGIVFFPPDVSERSGFTGNEVVSAGSAGWSGPCVDEELTG